MKPGHWATGWSQFGETRAPSVGFALKMHGRFLPRWPFKCPWIHLSEIRLLSLNALKKMKRWAFWPDEYWMERRAFTADMTGTSNYNQPDEELQTGRKSFFTFAQLWEFLVCTTFLEGNLMLISHVHNLLSQPWSQAPHHKADGRTAEMLLMRVCLLKRKD